MALPQCNIGAQPQSNATAALVHYRSREVVVAIQVCGDTVVVGETEDLGYFAG